MFFIEVDINKGYDVIVIGLFSTMEKAAEAARDWLYKEREGGLEDDICLCGWKCEPDSSNIQRTDLSADDDCIILTKMFREIEKEYPPIMEED